MKESLIPKACWNEGSSKFSKFHLERLDSRKTVAVQKVISQIERYSGIKRFSFIVHLLLLLLLSVVGNGASFLLIFLGFPILGGCLLILNPLLNFFLVFGRLMLKGE